ncbi:ribonuclease P protein subunit p29 [Plodia interpunctella]|uniref:ribonuclease P protein subunit p29 n=1 Tax=Plodia interpunctella TaxID=58824 RepID=UPI002367D662|nr:ribonuclease P protein subunit p29 [Plodia interpunctella]
MSKEGSFSKQDTEEAVVNFLKTNVPKSDVPKVDTELKKNFVLAKIKSKDQKKKAKKKKIHSLTRKEKAKLGFYVIPRNSVNYNEILPLNQIWEHYMSQIIQTNRQVPHVNSKSWENYTQTIYKADFHGSRLLVARSKCPSYVGKSGICIMDTKNTFKIVSEDNKVITIPKKECVFEMMLKNFRFTIFGKHLCARPAERSTKKIKSILHPDL